jgi:hypothetical protein
LQETFSTSNHRIQTLNRSLTYTTTDSVITAK